MTSTMIQIATNSGAMGAYVASPAGDTAPAVLLISTIFGIDDNMKGMCDDLAERGYVAVAPNMFWRDEDPDAMALPQDMERAVKRVMRYDFAQGMGDLRFAIEAARSQPGCNGKVALLGFCFGGPFAWRAACDGLGIGAGVSFHGTNVSSAMKPGDQPSCPVSLHYGDKDDFAPPEELAAVRKVAEDTGSEFIIHPGAGHGYMVPTDRGHYDPDAARASWDRALKLVDALRD